MFETVNATKANIATDSNVDEIMQQAFDAFNLYKKISPQKRAAFLETIADEIEKERAALVQTCKRRNQSSCCKIKWRTNPHY